MQRRDFFRQSAGVVGLASLTPAAGHAAAPTNSRGERTTDHWQQLGTGTTGLPQRKKTLQFDVAVIGGGLAGVCAAVAAARNGAKTVLIQDRSVLGGNASSEIRVNVNGVSHLKPDWKPERETGIIEEILLENRFQNPQESYSVWDHVIYDFATREPDLQVIMNTQATEAIMDGDTIRSAVCWQPTTETEITITARMFVDCSGDGLLAATAGALYRTGREAASEFDERYAPEKADGWQMGASILLHGKDMGRPIAYAPPSFAIAYDPSRANNRKVGSFLDGYWWVELGSEYDIIADQETNRHKLMGYLHGVWDYIKNSGKYPEAANYALEWVGSVPGRRESRRFIGDHVLSERDLVEHRHFPDAVAFGGWSLDEHCPGGIENLTDPPSFFHYRFSEVYEIPFRSLYSKNIANLLFAGRNVSQTHIALSSTRVMATCAVMGQAAGTAAAQCVCQAITPRQLASDGIDQLQEQLLRDDAFIPNRPARDSRDLARQTGEIFAHPTRSGDARLLIDGVSRDENGTVHHWQSDSLPAEVQLEWERPVSLSRVEIKCDTNLQCNIMMRRTPPPSHFTKEVPAELLKSLTAEAKVSGQWVEVASIDNNRTRLIKLDFAQVETTAVRLHLKETYGHPSAKLFEIRCYEDSP